MAIVHGTAALHYGCLQSNRKMLSASFYWVASESAIQGVRPTYYYVFNDAIPIDKRIETVENWLELPSEKRPHLITFYFPQVDHAEHLFGIDSKQTADAVHFVDESIGKMVKVVDSLELDVNFIVVSDHGMTMVDTVHTLPLPKVVDTSKFIVLPGFALLHLYAKDAKDIEPTFRALKKVATNFDVYLAEKLPGRLHYDKKDDVFNRTGDIVLLAHPPNIFLLGKGNTARCRAWL